MQENNSLGDKFEGFKADPSPQVWESIERSLDEKKRRRGFICWWAGLAASLIFGLMIWTNASNKTVQVNSQKITFHTQQKENQLITSRKEAKTNETGMYAKSNRSEHFSPIPANVNPINSTINRTKSTKSDKQAGLVNDEVNNYFSRQLLQNQKEGSINRIDMNVRTIDPIPNIEYKVTPNFFVSHIKEFLPVKVQDWQLQLLVGGAFTGREEMMVASTALNTMADDQGSATNGTYPIEVENPATIKHYRNIHSTISGLISYTSRSRFRITSGISYQRFFTQLLESKKIQAEMHFVHVPLLVDYSLLRSSRWQWHLGTGIGFGYGFNKNQAINYTTGRSDFLIQSSIRYALSNRFALQFQPQARVFFWDSHTAAFGKVSPWYLGGTLGGIWCF